eukprot:2480943-Prymnesium_polylepis.1
MQDYVASIAANAASLCPTCNEPLSVELTPKPADAGTYHGQGAPGSAPRRDRTRKTARCATVAALSP